MTENNEHYFEIKPKGTFNLNLMELKEYRELFYFFTWRDIKVKYKQTVLGFLWAVLQPLLMMIIFTFFFGRTLNVPSQNLPYPIFVFSGLLIWNIFSSGLSNSANSMVLNAAIIKKIYFPRIVIPVSSIIASLFDFLMSFILFIALLIYYKQAISPSAFFFWPGSILICFIATLGPGCLLAALNVKYRDFRYLVPFLIQVLLFLTPVIYPVSLLHIPALQYLIALSPVFAAVELFRAPFATHELDWNLINISLFSCVLFFVWGLGYFRKTEDFFADLA